MSGNPFGRYGKGRGYVGVHASRLRVRKTLRGRKIPGRYQKSPFAKKLRDKSKYNGNGSRKEV